MAGSVVELANSALQMVGLSTITSLSDNSPQARLANSFYSLSRDETLQLHPWSEAKKRVSLAQSVTAPAFGYSHAYQKPADFIRMLDPYELDIPFTVEGNQIFSDLSELSIVYIHRLEDVTQFSPLLARAVYCTLAAKIAMKGTNSQQIVAQARAERDDAINEARFQDSQGQYKERYQSTSWLAARHGTWGGSEPNWCSPCW